MTLRAMSHHPFTKRQRLILPVLVIGLYFYLNLFSEALTDDAFITLRYVKTFLNTGTWGFVPGYITNAVTSPLNVFLMAFVGIFLGATINSVIWLSAILLTLASVFLVRISFHLFETERFGYLAAGALIFNPLLISTLGLESILFVSLYILSAYLYLTQRWSLLAIALGLLTITRFDGILFFIIALLLVPAFREKAKFAAIFMLSIAPWYIFSWVYLGSVFPDTLFIKTTQRSWGTWDFLNGIDLYFRVYKLETIISLLFLPLMLLLFNKRVRGSALIGFLMLTGSAHFAGYSILHVPPYYWYYVPEITAIVLAGSFGLGILSRQDHLGPGGRKGIQAAAVTFFVLQASGIFYVLAIDGFPIKEMPIHTNWATHEQYREIGEWLKEHSSETVILVDGEIGTLGYYCDCHLLSFFSDRRWLREYIRSRTAGNGMRPALYRLNFSFLDNEAKSPQPDYLLSQLPGGRDTTIEGIKEWETSTKWIRLCLMKLSEYSP